MNINVTILDEIKDELEDYGCEYKDVEDLLFVEKRFPEKQKKAINIIQKAMEKKHGKGKLALPIGELARIEYGIREVEPWLRDHVVHATLSFFLGIYINKKLLSSRVNKFQWKLAGFFHDIGYPVEVAGSLLKSLSDQTNEIIGSFNVSYEPIRFKIVPENLESLTNDSNGLHLIQKCLDSWKLEINARSEYNRMVDSDRMVDSGRICHGIISSLAILKVIDVMYQKYNPKRKHSEIIKNSFDWNQNNFEESIIPACSAIFIHNLPEKCFRRAKIDYNRAPVAFLLKLSDCLQEWERPSLKNSAGTPPTSFDIKVENGKLILIVEIPDDQKEKMRKEISSYLAEPEIVHIQ